MRTVPLGPILIFIAFFILIYIGLFIAIILTAFINAVRKNENGDESFLDRFERLNKEYFYNDKGNDKIVLFRKSNKNYLSPLIFR